MSISRILARPYPPESLSSVSGMTSPDTFVPADELLHWIYAAYVDANGPLYNLEHAHLASARIGLLWTNADNVKSGKRILGQAEMPSKGGGNKWSKARSEQQLREWFGLVPDFLITIDAAHASECSDREFCFLIEHELRHCAQAVDEFGELKFSKDTGEPMFALKSHDIEVFIADAARYGAEAMGEEMVDLIIAAARVYSVSDTQIAQACGRKIVGKKAVA